MSLAVQIYCCWLVDIFNPPATGDPSPCVPGSQLLRQRVSESTTVTVCYPTLLPCYISESCPTNTDQLNCADSRKGPVVTIKVSFPPMQIQVPPSLPSPLIMHAALPLPPSFPVMIFPLGSYTSCIYWQLEFGGQAHSNFLAPIPIRSPTNWDCIHDYKFL